MTGNAEEQDEQRSEEPGEGKGRILTIPNVISVIRLSCLPLFLWLLFPQNSPGAAGFLLGALGATDWVDGYIARHYDQVSELGKVLDPVADRLLFFVGVTSIWYVGACPWWIAAAVLFREIVVAGATIALAAMGAKRIDVTWWGKAGTFALMVAFPFFLFSTADISWTSLARFIAYGWALPGLVLSYAAAAMYIPIGLKALREGREGRAAQAAEPDA